MRSLMIRDISEQKRYQEMEILLSHDFDNMNLEQLAQISSLELKIQEALK
jgi:hypothetical protein